jgi:REP element-mobilizing transposase RayT
LSIKNPFDVLIAEVQKDHVHIFLEVRPSISVSHAVQKIKGTSGYYLRKEFIEHLSNFFWKPVFWVKGYFLRSVGDITAQTAIRYIEFQHDHHNDKSTIELIRDTQMRFKTLDNWFNLKVLPELEQKG